VAVILAFLTFLPAAAAGGNVPEWLSQAASQPTPAWVSKDAVAVALYSEQKTTVSENGEVETLYREAYRILRPEGRSYGTVQVSFSNETPIQSLKAWSIPVSGKPYEVGEKQAIEMGGGEDWELYDDARMKALTVPAADPGNVVAYEYVQKERPYIAQDEWWFQEMVPVLQARYVLNLPSGWKLNPVWANYSSVQPQQPEPNEYVWDLMNVPAVPKEYDMPPLQAVAGRLAVSYYLPQTPDDPEHPSSWRNIGLWEGKITQTSPEPSPEIQAKVAELTANTHTTLGKIKALASYVQQDIRYVAVEIGIGGFQPHPASEVFQNQFGDCKDKATLLDAMLRVIGIQSYYAVAQAIDRKIVLPQFPSLDSFNHMILAIRLPDDVPTQTLYATVDDPKLGKLLFFDPTDPYLTFGYLPWMEQDNYVLLVAPGGGELVKLPLLPPATNRLMRVGQYKLDASGNLSGQTEETRWGQPGEDLRGEFLGADPRDRANVIERFLGTFLNNFQLTGATIGDLKLYNEPLTESYGFTALNYAKQAGDMLLVRPCVLGEKEVDFDTGKPRKYPVEFETTTLQTDQFEITLPPGYAPEQLPPPMQISDPFLDYKSQTKVTGNVLDYTRSYEIKKVFVPVSDFHELEKDFDAITADEQGVALFQPAPNGSSGGNAQRGARR
jgi:transglutaminase-like putative cysteine protease